MRWALAYALYWLGALVHHWNDDDRRFTAAGYRLYQWLMFASDTVQGDSANGPWSAASGTDARQRQDREDGPDPKGDGPTLEEGDAPPSPPPPGGLNA